MTKNKDTGSAKPTKRRTQVKELPKSEKELSAKEQKKVKGGSLMHNIMSGIIDNKPKQ